MARLLRQSAVVTLCAAVALACVFVVTAAAPVRLTNGPVPTSTATLTEVVAQPVDPIRAWSELRLAEMTPDEKVRSLLVIHVPGINPDGMRVAVDSVASGGAGVGGLILMRDNIPGTPEELASLTAFAQADPALPPIVAIDEEGGDVVRLPYDEFAGADSLRTADATETATAFAGRAALLSSVGVNLNFGLVADVTSDPGSFIYWRTFGDDPAAAAQRVAAGVSAETPVVASTLKHFPGHGRTGADSHHGIPTTDVSFDDWMTTDALPFDAGITAGAPAVMFGHLVFSSVDSVPATLSGRWHDILRTDLGFDGLAITDDMLMLQSSGIADLSDPYANAVSALSAGNDLLLYVLPADMTTVGIDLTTLCATLVANVSTERIDESALRVLMFRRALAPDALTWRPPCDVLCTAQQVGGFVSTQPVMLVRQDASSLS